LRLFGHIARAGSSQDHSRALRAAIRRLPVYWHRLPGRADQDEPGFERLSSTSRPPAAQSRPQLGVEACAGPFQVAKTRRDGYVLSKTSNCSFRSFLKNLQNSDQSQALTAEI